MGAQTGKRGLLTLGAAAVIAVYSAGYARTQEAADRFAEESAQRRRPGPKPPPLAPPAPVSVSPTKPMAKAAGAKTKGSARATPKPKPAAPKPDTAPAIVQPAPAPVVVDPPKDTVAKTPATDSARTLKWKDGKYSAWGYSRHGDLEATVEIKDGRIVTAEITQCYTRYPCGRIAQLPPQVLERQSEEVDVVTRVTESSDAFYYAVKQALAKAKT